MYDCKECLEFYAECPCCGEAFCPSCGKRESDKEQENEDTE